MIFPTRRLAVGQGQSLPLRHEPGLVHDGSTGERSLTMRSLMDAPAGPRLPRDGGQRYLSVHAAASSLQPSHAAQYARVAGGVFRRQAVALDERGSRTSSASGTRSSSPATAPPGPCTTAPSGSSTKCPAPRDPRPQTWRLGADICRGGGTPGCVLGFKSGVPGDQRESCCLRSEKRSPPGDSGRNFRGRQSMDLSPGPAAPTEARRLR